MRRFALTSPASQSRFDSSIFSPSHYPSAPRRAVFPKPDFWSRYNALPDPIREQADQAFELLKKNSRHPSLHFKKVGRFWSARVGLHYRAVGVEAPDGIVWFWIGTHTEYDKLIR